MGLALGQRAPEFELQDQHGQRISLSRFLGRNVVIVFYPFAFSNVCTGELTLMRDNLSGLVTDSSALVTISCDSIYALRSLADRDGLTFPMLSDFWPHGAVARSYHVFNGQLGAAARSTIVVDREGLIRWQVDNGLSAARDLDVYRKVLAELM